MAGLTDSEAGADPYVIAMAADVDGDLDADLLRSCAEAMLVRHPNVRASFFQGNLSRPVAVVPDARRPAVATRRGHRRPRPSALEADERAAGRSIWPRARPSGSCSSRCRNERWRLVVVAHHIVIDGWSLPVFVGELITLYRAPAATVDRAAAGARGRTATTSAGWPGRDPEASRQRWRAHLDGLDGPTLLTPALRAVRPSPACPGAPRSMLDERGHHRAGRAPREPAASRSTRCSRWPGRQCCRRSPTAPTWCSA